MPNILP